MKKLVIGAGSVSLLAAAASDDLLPQTYPEEKRLKMLLETYAKYNANLDFEGGFQATQPVIGILTTPVFHPLMETDTFQYPHFTWETNVHFVHYAGSWAVPIRYDISDEDLEQLLDSVNGIFMTGGGTPLIDRETGEMSFFYKNAKKVWDYMKRQKDEKGVDFPVFGICQGFELIHYLANEDHQQTLSKVVIYNESRKMDMKVEGLKENSQMFDNFPDELLDKMVSEPLLYHAHDWIIRTDTYAARSELSDFFNVLATDSHEGVEFVVAVEGKHYPVSGVMFHPETQNRHIVGQPDASINGKVNNEYTDAINYYFSEHVRTTATGNLDSHKFADPEFGMRMEWLNTNMGFTRGGATSNLVSFGFN